MYSLPEKSNTIAYHTQTPSPPTLILISLWRPEDEWILTQNAQQWQKILRVEIHTSEEYPDQETMNWQAA